MIVATHVRDSLEHAPDRVLAEMESRSRREATSVRAGVLVGVTR